MIRVIYKTVLLMGFVSAILGCIEKMSPPQLPSNISIEEYNITGNLISERRIDASNLVYQRLRTMLDDKQAKWKKSLVSYKQSTYILRGENIIIRCYSTKIVIDILEDKQYVSFERNMPGLIAKLGLANS